MSIFACLYPPMRTENNMDMQPRCIRSTFNAGNIINAARTEFKLRDYQLHFVPEAYK